ncbi:hypothetical protein B0H11DRAFT_1909363 [Mycena galericulata]|nr:hypothetical protein B0H11DRAFT_1909363 [Mycena galericulata]
MPSLLIFGIKTTAKDFPTKPAQTQRHNANFRLVCVERSLELAAIIKHLMRPVKWSVRNQPNNDNGWYSITPLSTSPSSLPTPSVLFSSRISLKPSKPPFCGHCLPPGLRLAQDITPIRCPSQSLRKPSNLQRTGLHSIRCHWSCFLILNCPLSSIVNVSILKSVSLSRFASSYFKTLNHSTTSMHQDFFLQVALKFLLEAQALFFVTHPSA